MSRVRMAVVGCVLLGFAGCGEGGGGSSGEQAADISKPDGGLAAAEKLKSMQPQPKASKASKAKRSQ